MNFHGFMRIGQQPSLQSESTENKNSGLFVNNFTTNSIYKSYVQKLILICGTNNYHFTTKRCSWDLQKDVLGKLILISLCSSLKGYAELQEAPDMWSGAPCALLYACPESVSLAIFCSSGKQ